MEKFELPARENIDIEKQGDFITITQTDLNGNGDSIISIHANDLPMVIEYLQQIVKSDKK